MNMSSFQIMKDSWIFLWNHKMIVAAIFIFGLVTVGICAALVASVAMGAVLIWGMDTLLLSFQSLSAGIMPHLTPWIAIMCVALLFMVILLIMFYPRICAAWYVLHALRKQPVTIGKTLRQGFRLTLAAWQVILGLTLVPVVLVSFGMVLFIMNGLASIIFAALAVCFILWFYIATYFIEQLVADGAIDFAATVATSWNYVQRSWWQIFGIIFFLWLTNVIISALLAPIFFSFFGFLLSSWYAVASNKIYLIVRSESGYKYSSE